MAALTYEHTVELAATPASASTARRVVRQTLAECQREQWGDAAELAVSELVTNGVLHAHTPLTVAVRCTAEGLRVEVRDTNPMHPAQRQYGHQATTGRGMALVAAVTTSHGVAEIASGGKAVWFTISAQEAEPDPDDLLDAWPDDGDLDAMPLVAGRSVTLVGLPPTLWLAAAEHHDGLLRELALFRHGQGQSVDDLVGADCARSAIQAALERALTDARAAGKARNPLPDNHPATLDPVPDLLDLELEALGSDPAMDFAVLQDVLDEAERLAVHGLLLARPGLPEVVALRDWAAESIIAQLAGQAPAPWPGAAAEQFAQELDQHARQLDWDASPVRDADRGAVAADDGNRILAISQPLAEELGWDPAELIGRRVVAIVPPRFREAHVAGFTRHLTTGEAHALDVRLELPVLRADATEVDCEFFIQAHRSASGRAVYIAWVTPL
jgi:PAS domain S-box-containing protein